MLRLCLLIVVLLTTQSVYGVGQAQQEDECGACTGCQYNVGDGECVTTVSQGWCGQWPSNVWCGNSATPAPAPATPSPTEATPAPTPPTPAPTPAPTDEANAMPPEGVEVLDGGYGRFAPVTCVSDPSQFTVERTLIAAQCCEADGACRRYIGADNATGCIVGVSPDIEATTYAEAVKKCADRGLQLCEEACVSKGCGYNANPVWTRKPCEANTTTTTASPIDDKCGGCKGCLHFDGICYPEMSQGSCLQWAQNLWCGSNSLAQISRAHQVTTMDNSPVEPRLLAAAPRKGRTFLGTALLQTRTLLNFI